MSEYEINRAGICTRRNQAGTVCDEPFGPESFDPELTTEGLSRVWAGPTIRSLLTPDT